VLGRCFVSPLAAGACGASPTGSTEAHPVVAVRPERD